MKRLFRFFPTLLEVRVNLPPKLSKTLRNSKELTLNFKLIKKLELTRNFKQNLKKLSKILFVFNKKCFLHKYRLKCFLSGLAIKAIARNVPTQKTY